MTKQQCIDLIGEDWYNIFPNNFLEFEIENILSQMKKDRKDLLVLPGKGLTFRVFKMLSPKDVKVCVLGQDVYSTYGVPTGIAFDCSNTGVAQPSLVNIIKEVKNSYPNSDVNANLISWVEQGVFLVNTALTVLEGQPESHLEYWKKFTETWIKEFSKKYPHTIWMLFGRKAIEYEKLLWGKPIVIKTSHPSPLGANKKSKDYPAFLGSKCFENCNMILKSLKIKEINW